MACNTRWSLDEAIAAGGKVDLAQWLAKVNSHCEALTTLDGHGKKRKRKRKENEKK